MSKIINVIFCILGVTILLFSCKKSNASKVELASLDLTTTNALIIPQDTAILSKSGSADELYQLTNSSALSLVDYINVNGFSMDGHYSPEYMNPVNNL